MATVEQAIDARLNEYSALTALCSSIYAVLAPQSASLPFITWRLFDERVNSHMASDSTPTEASFQVTIFAADFNSIPPIAEQVKNALQRYAATIETVVVQTTFYDGSNDAYDIDDDYYQRSMDFRIFYEEQ